MAGELYDFEQAEREAQAASGTPSTPSGSGGGFFGGYTGFSDMFDGGGAGRSGASFAGGGILSDFANMVARPRRSYGSDTGMRAPVGRPSMSMIKAARDRVNAPYSLARDLFDGGGLGRRATLEEINARQGFRGGTRSMMANMVGIRPMGANDLGLVASYDAALASRPDISNQMGLLNNVTAKQEANDVGGKEAGLLNMGYPANASGMLSKDLRGQRAEVLHKDAPNFPFDPLLNSDPKVVAPPAAAPPAAAPNYSAGLQPAATTNRAVGRQREPDMTSNRAIGSTGIPASEMFSGQLQDAVGLDRAIGIMSGPYASQAFSEFTANGNQLPSRFSQRELNIGIYGDPFGRGSMVGR